MKWRRWTWAPYLVVLLMVATPHGFRGIPVLELFVKYTLPLGLAAALVGYAGTIAAALSGPSPPPAGGWSRDGSRRGVLSI